MLKNVLCWLNLTTFVTKGILFVFDTTFRKKTKPSHKRRWVLHNSLLTSQWLQRLTTSITSNFSYPRAFTLVHFSQIILHDFDASLAYYFFITIQTLILLLPLETRNKNNKRSYEISVVFIPWKVFLKLKFEHDKQFLHYKDNYY
jgi:hypothetical protein